MSNELRRSGGETVSGGRSRRSDTSSSAGQEMRASSPSRRVELRRAQKARRRQELLRLWDRNPRLVLGGLLGVVLLVFALFLAGRVLDSSPSPAVVNSGEETASSEPGPYELVEAASGFDLGGVVDAKFVSLTFPDPEGARSIMLTRDRPEFQEMAAAVAGSRKVEDESTSPGSGQSITLTFVTQGRETASLTLGGGDLFFWRGSAYRADGDLQLMAERAGLLG